MQGIKLWGTFKPWCNMKVWYERKFSFPYLMWAYFDVPHPVQSLCLTMMERYEWLTDNHIKKKCRNSIEKLYSWWFSKNDTVGPSIPSKHDALPRTQFLRSPDLELLVPFPIPLFQNGAHPLKNILLKLLHLLIWTWDFIWWYYTPIWQNSAFQIIFYLFLINPFFNIKLYEFV